MRASAHSSVTLLGLATTLFGLSAFAQETEFPESAQHGEARVGAELGFDNNIQRTYNGAGSYPVTDVFAALHGTLKQQWERDNSELDLKYDIGYRKFVTFWEEDTLAQVLSLGGNFFLNDEWRTTQRFLLKQRSGGERSYTALAIESAAYVQLANSWEVGGVVRAQKLFFWSFPQLSFIAPTVGLVSRFSLSPLHSLSVGTDLSWAGYPKDTAVSIDDFGTPVLGTALRADRSLVSYISYQLRKPFILQADYSFFLNQSNNAFQNYALHRLSVSLGWRAHRRLGLFLQGAFQLGLYPKGYFYDRGMLTKEDDESHNTLGAKAVWVMSKRVDIWLKFTTYQNPLSRQGISYSRSWVGLGFDFRLW